MLRFESHYTRTLSRLYDFPFVPTPLLLTQTSKTMTVTSFSVLSSLQGVTLPTAVDNVLGGQVFLFCTNIADGSYTLPTGTALVEDTEVAVSTALGTTTVTVTRGPVMAARAAFVLQIEIFSESGVQKLIATTPPEGPVADPSCTFTVGDISDPAIISFTFTQFG